MMSLIKYTNLATLEGYYHFDIAYSLVHCRAAENEAQINTWQWVEVRTAFITQWISYTCGKAGDYPTPVANLGGVRGLQMHPPFGVFCVNNCTSPSNDYTAVECSNNNQAQLHTHVSVPYWSPDVWQGLEIFIYVTGSGHGNPQIFGCVLHASGWTPLSKFLNPLCRIDLPPLAVR